MIRVLFLSICFFNLCCKRTTQTEPKITNSLSSVAKEQTQQTSNRTTLLDLVDMEAYTLQQDTLSIEERAQKLVQLYAQIKNHNSDSVAKSKELEFFRYFPNDFETFVNIYGWKNWPDTLSKGLLYGEEYFGHITYFLSMDRLVPLKIYLKKLIGISMGGHWDADEVDAIQSKIMRSMMDNPMLFGEVLSTYSKSDWESFWIFYFDSPHPRSEIPKYLNIFSESYPEMYDIMQQALFFVQNDWKNH